MEDLPKQLMRELLAGDQGNLSLMVTDQGMLEYLISSWAQLIVNRQMTKPIQQISILGEPFKEVSQLEMLLERNIARDSLQIHSLPVVCYWGANRYGNQSTILHQRLRALYALQFTQEPAIILSSHRAMAQTISDPRWVNELILRLRCGDDRDMDEVREALIDLGYVEAELSSEPGYFTLRGGIIDVFPGQATHVIRLEFFGDTIQSIRFVDPDSQRSFSEVSEVAIYLALETPPCQSLRRENVQKLYESLIAQEIDRHERQAIIDAFEKGYIFPGYGMMSPLFRQGSRTSSLELLDQQTIVVLMSAKEKIIEDYQSFFAEQQQFYDDDLQAGKASLEPSQHLFSPEEFQSWLEKIPYVIELKSQDASSARTLRITGRSQLDATDRALLASQSGDGISNFAELVKKGRYACVAIVHELDQAQRLCHLIEHQGLVTKTYTQPLIQLIDAGLETDIVHVCQGYLSEWLFLEDRQLLIMPDFLLFGASAPRRPRIRSQRQLQSLLSSFRDLAVGSPVVHVEHGIGRYRGIQTLELAGLKNDFLIIEYAAQDKIYVPVDRLNLVQKYSAGDDAGQAPLDRLKSQGWVKRKGRVKKAIQDLADKLLQIQARRRLVSRAKYSEPTDLYFQFEGDFPFDETEDQLQAIAEVNQDFMCPEPMDRLVCGDVGFGKTEIALRAAMRAVLEGFQVMILAPTTVLSFQHFKTFERRFQKYGVGVGLLNRFVSLKQAKETTEKFAKGSLDILIGTHRILSKDVKPKNLGLIVIDEEQRFGVTHKEAIKDLKAGCDVLTLTATPIPRSLHMAMLGLRDISVIMTPPVERLSIKTYVSKFDPDLIRRGVERELLRGGQVFFVHNRVEDILQMRSYLGEIMPGIDIRIAHGQMREHELERVMIDFIEQKFPFLLCTTIIESGLDIPNVNTIFVNRAEHFGLAQLYQMRGRVGRSSKQSYAYFLTQVGQSLQVDAERRLEILAAHQDLGSGFQIANYDLEMRGAGNLLGGEQSGHVADVGLELYTNLLHEEILRLRQGEEVKPQLDVEIKLSVSATIPADYISSENQRLTIYKSLFSAEGIEEVQQLARDVQDRFGNMPEPCIRIFRIAEIKILLRAIKASSITYLAKGVFEIKFYSLSETEIATIAETIQKHPDQYSLKSDFSLLIHADPLAPVLDQESETLNQLIARIQPLSYLMTKAD
ncbi:MAG: transcription-repair coupling factor [Oligoflexus sp.]